jgi:lysine-N-methylase
MTVTARYLRRFRCIAERCEDTCCAGLRIPLTKDDLERLSKGLADGQLHVVQHDGALRQKADGTCVLLGADNLCSAQTRGGEAALPGACAMFPRVLTRVGSAVELSGTLACPELTRLLLADEDALESDTLPDDQLPRVHVSQVLEGPSAREALRLLWRGPAPLDARMASLAQLACAFDLLPDATARTAMVESMDVHGELQRGEALLRGTHVDDGGSVTFSLSLLRNAKDRVLAARFQGFASAVLAAYHVPEDSGAPLPASMELGARHQEAVHAVGEQLFARVLGRYVEHFFGRTPWGTHPNLGQYVLRMAVEVSVVRSWLAGRARSAPADTAAVEVIQLFAKHIARSEALVSLLGAWSRDHPVHLLGRTLLFA